MGYQLLFASALVAALTAGAGTAERCGGGGGGKMVVDVTSRRNATGHRHLKADLTAPDEKLGNDPVDFRVEQAVEMISGVRHFHLTAYTTALDPRIPPPGYELVRGLGWYRHHLQPLTWEEARLACEAEGAHLAVLNSKEEAAALKGIYAKASSIISGTTWSGHAFIGFSDMIEGQYITIFGETLDEAGYAEWDKGEPNNYKYSFDPESDCGGVVRSTFLLEDLPCRANLSSFCEYPL